MKSNIDILISDDTKNTVVDNVDLNNDNLKIIGWTLRKGEVINNYNCNVMLQEVNNHDNIILLPTDMYIRKDVSVAYNDGTNYERCGFYAQANVKKLLLNKKKYEIIIRNFNNGKQSFIKTGKYVGGKSEKTN